MSRNVIPEDKKAEILADMIVKRNAQMVQLENCLAKVKSDQEYLSDFVMPIRRTNINDTVNVFFRDLVDLKKILNGMSDEKLQGWYFGGGGYDDPVNICYDTVREETDAEYELRVHQLKHAHLASKRATYEKDLNKNIKGLKRGIEALTNTINQIQPPPSPEAAFMASIAHLDPFMQAEIKQAAQNLAFSYRRQC